MSAIGLPFNPLRDRLYSRQELFEGLAKNDPKSYSQCADIAILSYFAKYGRGSSEDVRSAAAMESLHDNSISMATNEYLRSQKKVVAVMGGHGLVRKTEAYAGVAYLSYKLSRLEFLVASGGGPGAMEATHLGAFLSRKSEDSLKEAILRLGDKAELPKNIGALVRDDGSIDEDIAAQIHAWLIPAIEICDDVTPGEAGRSLGVPTWLYGFEPTSPFATDIAKYFQNSLREDGLVTLATHGIIYAEGSAGTVQEIFQDATQNYYGDFCPMVFLSAPAAAGSHYWEKTLPVRPLIEALLGKKPGFKKVLFTDSLEQTIEFLAAAPSGRMTGYGRGIFANTSAL
jgi:predicted Rossmann-fold nucleotide-binding protein